MTRRATDEKFLDYHDLQVDYGVGRPCAEDGCITILNRWHTGPLCYIHQGEDQEDWFNAQEVAWN